MVPDVPGRRFCGSDVRGGSRLGVVSHGAEVIGERPYTLDIRQGVDLQIAARLRPDGWIEAGGRVALDEVRTLQQGPRGAVSSTGWPTGR